jgi:hypothetical protein
VGVDRAIDEDDAREVLAQHTGEVTGSRNEKVVKAFAAQRADEALRDRVRPRHLDRRADDPDVSAGEDGVRACSTALVNSPLITSNASSVWSASRPQSASSTARR